MSRKTGFTLIELLVVIGTIGILIAIAQPMLTNSAAKTYEYQCESRLRQIGVAMNAYCQDYGAFPASLAKVDALIQDRAVLSCPRTDREYWYQQPEPNADRNAAIAACINPRLARMPLPHRAGHGYLVLMAGGGVRRAGR